MLGSKTQQHAALIASIHGCSAWHKACTHLGLAATAEHSAHCFAIGGRAMGARLQQQAVAGCLGDVVDTNRSCLPPVSGVLMAVSSAGSCRMLQHASRSGRLAARRCSSAAQLTRPIAADKCSPVCQAACHHHLRRRYQAPLVAHCEQASSWRRVRMLQSCGAGVTAGAQLERVAAATDSRADAARGVEERIASPDWCRYSL